MTTKIKLPNIDTSYDYSSLSPAAFTQANAAFIQANAAFSTANSALTGSSSSGFNPFLLSGM